MDVYILHVSIGDNLQLAGAFSKMEDAYDYLRNNNLVGTVNKLKVID